MVIVKAKALFQNLKVIVSYKYLNSYTFLSIIELRVVGMKENAIKIINLSFKYKYKYIFKDLNLHIAKASFVTIIGSMGSGKSTLGKILKDYLSYEGNIIMDKRKFALITDLYEDISSKVGDIITSDLIKKFKLNKEVDTYYTDLDLFSRIKVSIAKCIIENKDIIYLDEVCDRLNRKDREFIFKLLREYVSKNNFTIIINTNDLEDTLYSDKTIILGNGKVIFEGTKEELYYDEKIEQLGFSMPFIVKLSHNLMLYGLLDKVYFNSDEVINKLWN